MRLRQPQQEVGRAERQRVRQVHWPELHRRVELVSAHEPPVPPQLHLHIVRQRRHWRARGHVRLPARLHGQILSVCDGGALRWKLRDRL